MSNPVGSVPETTSYGSRIGMTEDSLSILEQSRGCEDPWEMEETKPNVEALERGMPGVYLSCFDMLLTEDATWLVKVSEASSALALPMNRVEPREEPEQCPVIDSQEQGISPGMEGQEEERSLEQVQSMVVGEVLKDIETACKLLNITPGRLLSSTPAAVASVLQRITDKETDLKQNIFHLPKMLKCFSVFANIEVLIQILKLLDLTRKINTYLCGHKMTELLNHILTDAKLCLPAPGSV